MEHATYIAEVIKEIKNLKKHLTEEQKGRLDFGYFYPESPLRCIYGQATRGCFSKEATELIEKCANQTMSCSHVFGNDINDKLRNSPPRRHLCGYYTLLEFYIVNTPQNNEHIINYIKGIDKRLKLK